MRFRAASRQGTTSVVPMNSLELSSRGRRGGRGICFSVPAGAHILAQRFNAGYFWKQIRIPEGRQMRRPIRFRTRMAVQTPGAGVVSPTKARHNTSRTSRTASWVLARPLIAFGISAPAQHRSSKLGIITNVITSPYRLRDILVFRARANFRGPHVPAAREYLNV
jgi:hypothetical protein